MCFLHIKKLVTYTLSIPMNKDIYVKLTKGRPKFYTILWFQENKLENTINYYNVI
jgi:hypothetical protein